MFEMSNLLIHSVHFLFVNINVLELSFNLCQLILNLLFFLIVGRVTRICLGGFLAQLSNFWMENFKTIGTAKWKPIGTHKKYPNYKHTKIDPKWSSFFL